MIQLYVIYHIIILIYNSILRFCIVTDRLLSFMMLFFMRHFACKQNNVCGKSNDCFDET